MTSVQTASLYETVERERSTSHNHEIYARGHEFLPWPRVPEPAYGSKPSPAEEKPLRVLSDAYRAPFATASVVPAVVSLYRRQRSELVKYLHGSGQQLFHSDRVVPRCLPVFSAMK
jgi:hypothetical protein